MKTIIFVQNAVFVGDNHGQLIIEAAKFAAKQGSVPQYVGCAIDEEVLELYVEFSKVPEQLLNPIKVEEVDLDELSQKEEIEIESIESDLTDHAKAEEMSEEQAICYSLAKVIRSYIPIADMECIKLSDIVSIGIKNLSLLKEMVDGSMPFLMKRILANIVKNPSRINESCIAASGEEHPLCTLVYCIEWVTSNEKCGFWSKIYSVLRSTELTNTEKYSKIKAIVAEFEMKN